MWQQWFCVDISSELWKGLLHDVRYFHFAVVSIRFFTFQLIRKRREMSYAWTIQLLSSLLTFILMAPRRMATTIITSNGPRNPPLAFRIWRWAMDEVCLRVGSQLHFVASARSLVSQSAMYSLLLRANSFSFPISFSGFVRLPDFL